MEKKELIEKVYKKQAASTIGRQPVETPQLIIKEDIT